MRRTTVFRLVGAVLVIGIGAYSVIWWIAAGKVEKAANAWRENAKAQKLDAAWQGMHVAGYPLALRLDLSGVTLKDGASNPPAELQAPALSATLRPWNLHAVTLDAPDGLTATFGPDGAPLATIEAKSATGAAAPGSDGAARVWLSLYGAKATAGITLEARAVHAWATLPQAPPGLSPTIDDVGFGVTLQGVFPSGPLRQAATAWRDGGGTLDLDHLDLRWGDMQINGSGTLALDSSLQPVGGFSGGVSGFDELLNALVAAGRIKAGDARIARIALAMLAKTGPGGRPEIASSLTIQNGEMFLGPAKLGPAPRIDW